uniref:tRNA (adenine(22)-N(1))-methyltransferase n=1 Tax=Eubacterium cellulosolvens TaxID=29322 RepID=UPI0004823404|nr:class I SAM-dependent methyltransferase [[Eubacterium] cellulosolvens]
MNLSVRLQTAASFVTEGSRFADIGTDHGYLPIDLCGRGVVPMAIAMDVRKGPLDHARENIESHGFSETIETRLSDGLEKLAPGEVNSVAITGMGGLLIRKILAANPAVCERLSEMILGPQSETGELRRYLYEQGFIIDREEMILEDGKYYPILHVVRASKKSELSDVEYEFGPCLLRDRNKVLYKYLGWRRTVAEKILKKLEQGDSEQASRRLFEVKEEMQLIEAAIQNYEM